MPRKDKKRIKKQHKYEKLVRFVLRNKHDHTCWGIVVSTKHAIMFRQVFIDHVDGTKKEMIILEKQRVPKKSCAIHTSEGVPYLVIICMDAITHAL